MRIRIVNEEFKEMHNCVIFRVGRRRGFGFRSGRVKTRHTRTVVLVAETGIGLTATSGGFIEEGTIELRNNDVVRSPEVVS